jgi:type IV secretion system protein VirB9
LRPIGNKPDTNITVLTDRRVYNFQLEGHKSKKGLQHESEEMMFQVAFKYPEEEARHQRYAAEKNALNQRLKSHDPSQPQNFNYWVKGEETLAPNRAYDDRRFTYLTFANNKDMPAIYIENPDGTESLVNAHVEEDVIVLHKVARKFVLRKGKLVACVYNRSYDPNGIDNKTGTTVPGVTREIKEGA